MNLSSSANFLKKNHSLGAHGLHSRLQLIRNKMDVRPTMTPPELIDFNRKYFDLAAESVATFHNIKCGRSEYYDAAELFLAALKADNNGILAQPLWTERNDQYVVELRGSQANDWTPMTESMFGGSSSNIKLMTREEASLVVRRSYEKGELIDCRVAKYNPQMNDNL